MTAVLCVDVGSTFTKAVLADRDSGELLATAEHPTTTPDVLAGIAAVRSAAQDQAGRTADDVLVCSSAGGGLRLAVVGYERLVTADAGHRVALSAGGRVVHVATGRLDRTGVEELRAARPDLIVLTGGTDGGNADVVIHNAQRIGIARLPVPVVLAANVDAAQAAAAELTSRGRTVTITANVLPRIGQLDPWPARQAIREAFLAHVIGGKGLSRRTSRLDGRSFAELVRAPTPDAVLTGAELLAEDVLLVDVGGATTDVYSVLTPDRRTGQASGTAEPDAHAAGELWHARTVEGDLGVRWSATGVVDAARAEQLIDDDTTDELGGYAAALAGHPGRLPDADELRLDLRLAQLAALIAVRRHGRPARPGSAPRPLRAVSWVIGSGGVLRHADAGARAGVLRPLVSDHAGGWAVPEGARLAVDAKYTLFAAGLLAPTAPEAAARLARAGLATV